MILLQIQLLLSLLLYERQQKFRCNSVIIIIMIMNSCTIMKNTTPIQTLTTIQSTMPFVNGYVIVRTYSNIHGYIVKKHRYYQNRQHTSIPFLNTPFRQQQQASPQVEGSCLYLLRQNGTSTLCAILQGGPSH